LAIYDRKAHLCMVGTVEPGDEEVIMIDQDVARLWADHHEAFSRWVDDAGKGVGNAFRALNRIQYEAPWKTIARGRARH
jgi:hypothetical protein